MAGDYLQSQGVKTQRDNEFKIKFVDGQSGTTATKILTVADVGDTIVAGTNDFGLVPLASGSDSKWHSFACDSSGRLLVVPTVTTSMGPVNDYAASADVANGTPVNHDYTVTSGKTATQIQAFVSSAGLFKWELGTFDGSVFTAKAAGVTEPSSPSLMIPLQALYPVLGNGTTKIRLVITNLESTSETAYSTIQAVEE